MRFYFALWVSKLFAYIYKLRGKSRSDRPGLLALKICPKFLLYIKKPKLVIGVSGTNGKSTVSSLINDMLRLNNYNVLYNDWGANFLSGHAICLMNGVNLFNKTKFDAAVLEIDEITAPDSIPYLKPDYLIVTNICRDSIKRNAYPEYIFSRINYAITTAPDMKVILNADDPISSFLGENSPNDIVHFGFCDLHTKTDSSNIDDFSICPRCGSIPQYEYKNYRHFGSFYCPHCGLKRKDIKYYSEQVAFGKQELTVVENNQHTKYPLISDTIFNAYNILSVIALFREMQYSPEMIIDGLHQIKIPESRETCEVVNGIKLYTYVSKGQNGSSTSIVADYLINEPSTKELIFILDEQYGNKKIFETITWLYEVDFELLKSANIKKIIIGGVRYLDYQVRLLVAGIDPKKIVCVPSEEETASYVDFNNVDSIYVLHDVLTISKGQCVKNLVKQRLIEGAMNEKN